MPDATAAAEPPLDPLVEWSVDQGLRVGPYSSGSQAGAIPNSGVLVRPRMINPARSSRVASSLVTVETLPDSDREPSVNGVPARSITRSLSRYGTPANRPGRRPSRPAARASASSYVVEMTALRVGLSASIRSIAASTNSTAVTSPARTRSACAVASIRESSLVSLFTAPPGCRHVVTR